MKATPAVIIKKKVYMYSIRSLTLICNRPVAYFRAR